MAKEPKKKVATKKVAAKKAVAPTPVAVKTVAKKVATKKVAAPKTSSAAKPAKVAKAAKAAVVTTVVARCDVGFGNTVFIRGEGKGLSWDSGIALKNNGQDEWVWQSTEVTGDTPFKLLINDEVWAEGENCIAIPGTTVEITPSF